MIDHETKQILDEQKELADLIGHRAWGIAREKLVQRILDLQTVGQVADVLEKNDAMNFMIEVKANKRAAEVLYSWLSDVEGTASQVTDNVALTRESYIVTME